MKKSNVRNFAIIGVLLLTLSLTFSNFMYEYMLHIHNPELLNTTVSIYEQLYSGFEDLSTTNLLIVKLIGNTIGYLLYVIFHYGLIFLVVAFILSIMSKDEEQAPKLIKYFSISLMIIAVGFLINGICTMLFGVIDGSYINMTYFIETDSPLYLAILNLLNPFNLCATIYLIYNINKNIGVKRIYLFTFILFVLYMVLPILEQTVAGQL